MNSYPTLLGSSAASLILSPTPLWQQLTLPSFTVPVGNDTHRVKKRLGFLNSSTLSSNGVEYPGFVDDATLTVTPEPSTLALFVRRHRPAGLRMAKAVGRPGGANVGWTSVQDELLSGQAGATFPSSRRLDHCRRSCVPAILLSTAQLLSQRILPSPAPPVYEIAFVSTTGTDGDESKHRSLQFLCDAAGESGCDALWPSGRLGTPLYRREVAAESMPTSTGRHSTPSFPSIIPQGQLVANAWHASLLRHYHQSCFRRSIRELQHAGCLDG